MGFTAFVQYHVIIKVKMARVIRLDQYQRLKRVQ